MDEQNIPIDINTQKLLDWLISRRHVNKDWQKSIIKVREKINSAIQDMPAHDGIVKLLSGQHINYFHCLKIIEILKETEADTKNLFGRYGSQRMKDWKDVVSSYEKDNLYLAEAAQVLMRNVAYEVPSLRKQVAKCEQTQIECEKKIKDYNKVENLALNEFHSSCKQLGIAGNNIKKELVALLEELPFIYEKSAENIKTVKPAVELYDAFVKFQTGAANVPEVIPMLQYLIKNGNTTTYEYTYGEKPVSIEDPPLDITIEESEIKRPDEINFGDGIDFGSESNIDFSPVNIDFSNLDSSAENIELSTPLSEGDIDWGHLNVEEDFEIVEHVDYNINLEESGIVVEKSGLDGGVAKGNDAYTILDNPKTRDNIINDLLELKGFLMLRLYEMSSESNFLSMTQIDAPTILQMQSVETLTGMIDCVGVALNELTNKRIEHLHNIKHSAKYVDVLTANLKQKLNIVNRMKGRKQVLEDKIKENLTELRKLQPDIKNIVEKTKILQKEIESDISKKYKGRPVNIVGAVNMM